ncbi:hypothetical protein SAMN04515654_1136 [Halanaerobium congolense]|uniref:DUF2330 domain-containing protein n=1 Tax=Halanaerobium congolense TaxID=54121 RepID=A0A1G8MY20_9FIRM|nr:DUF2330 domain-containing protein [Halanaerobium congolense]OEG63524.1 MAG: DUF2330 domain-containing protein [Halanaerobium sp. MDAL1]SDI72773.1 hypothetical protein SAMN04515654_1136 [Halanaerobium congolense]SET42726.1 hypothetical protein SAMN04515653_11362 [Halanaerobium congolense]
MKKTILLLVVFLLILPTAASADRGSIPYIPEVRIFEPSQDALIAWNGEEEILILSTELYASEATKILQVLPLPAEPEVKKSSRDVLRRANEFVIQKFFDNLRQPVFRSEISKTPAAEIKEEVVIGSHDILVVKVLNQDYFVSWVNNHLEEKGEKTPQISDSLKSTINNYINRGYNYFVFDTIEVSPNPEINEAISYKFKTDELYYPLEITKSDHGVSEISLLVLTNQNLINYGGIAKNRVNEKNPTVELNLFDVEYISSDIHDLFIKKNDDLLTYSSTIQLLNWSIKDDLANFNSDLLVDSKLEGLLKNEVIYQGTTFIDFQAEANYPYPSEKEMESISGVVEMRMGSRMHPWLAPSINGKALFNAHTNRIVNNFDAEGEKITVKGYSSKDGQITMRDPIDKMPVLINISDVFYVTEIVGWTPYTGIAISSDGKLNNERSRFWLKNK